MTEKVRCPSCGYSLDAQAPVCGNCGTDLSGYRVGPVRLPARGYSGPPKGLIGLIAFLAIAGGAFLFYRDEVRDLIKDAQDAFDQPNDDFEAPQIEISIPPIDLGSPGFIQSARFERVRDLTNAVNAGGLRCGRVQVDHQDEYISTGSCRAGNVHVQINIYLFRPSLKGANELLRASPFATVHDQNWWVITQAATARDIHKILGGNLRIP